MEECGHGLYVKLDHLIKGKDQNGYSVARWTRLCAQNQGLERIFMPRMQAG
jgi:hypothetical protein